VDGAELTGILGSHQGRTVAAWRAGERTVVGFYDVAEATDVTVVSQVAVRELEGPALVPSAVQVDRPHGLLLASTVLVDIEATSAHRLSGQGKLAAGHAWVTGGGKQTQIDRTGATVAITGATQPAVPDVITDNGMALTRVGGAADGLLYALVENGPTPTPSPTLTATPTDASPTSSEETP
jgi:hypothetical protein